MSYYYSQYGGYPKGFSLKKNRNTNKNRAERTFTEVFPDGSTSGKYIGYDYLKKDGRWQGTAWVTAVKKAYRKYCSNERKIVLNSLLQKDFGHTNIKQLNKSTQKEYRENAMKMQCDPQIIVLRETTPGNNLYNFKYRTRQYYVESEDIKDKQVNPSSGLTSRVYRFNTVVKPMRLGESYQDFIRRKM